MSETKENGEKNETDLITDEDQRAEVTDEIKKPNNKLLYLLIVIIVVVFSAGFVFINNKVKIIGASLEKNNISTQNNVQTVNDQINDVQSRFTSMQGKLEEIEAQQEVLTHTYSKPIEQQIYFNEDYALAEIEHLLIIASHNLEIDQNIATALSAMEAADTRLKGLGDPAVLSAREQLTKDMNALRSINQADISGMAFSLSDFISHIDDLVIKENVVLEKQEAISENVDESVSGIKHFFSLVFKELKSLIIITRDTDVGKARLLPDEVYFLKANLKLELANARFAVFNRDTENLHKSIEHIQGWLKDYFDLSDANTTNIYDALESLKKIELTLPVLDISSALESVRALSRHQEENINIVEELMPEQ